MRRKYFLNSDSKFFFLISFNQKKTTNKIQSVYCIVYVMFNIYILSKDLFVFFYLFINSLIYRTNFTSICNLLLC